MKQKYYNLNELLELIKEPNKSLCKKMYEENKELFEKAKGSKIKHQAWEGGYIDHLQETMNIALILYQTLNKQRKLNFSLSDALLVLFLHDLEKPWKYSKNKEKVKELEQFKNNKEFVKNKIKETKFILNQKHWNAIKYIHGEGEDYNLTKNIQKPLAAFVHTCDTISARIWHDFPKQKNKW